MENVLTVGKERPAPIAFISYKWQGDEHGTWVESFVRDLRKRGIDAMLDRWEVGLGQSFSDYMTSAIAHCDAFLFVITNKSVESVEGASEEGGAIRFEVQLATARKVSGSRFRFIGILREGDRPPTHLSDARYADFRDDSRYQYELAMLVADLKGRREKPELPTTLDLSLIAEPAVFNIWRGLPHGQSYLIAESIPRELQNAISSGLIQLILRDSAKRGYSFKVVAIDLDATIRNTLRELFEAVSRADSSTPLDLEPLSEAGVTTLFKGTETKSAESHVLEFLLRSNQRFGHELAVKLSLLRGLQSQFRFGSGHKTLSTVLMLADLNLVDIHLDASPWFNIYEFVGL